MILKRQPVNEFKKDIVTKIKDKLFGPTNRHKTIMDHFYPMYIYLRFILVANFTIDGDITTGKIILKPFDIVLNILVVTIDAALLYLSTIGFLFSSKIYLLNLGHQLIIVVAVVTLLTIHTVMFFHRKTIWNLFQQMHYLDLQMDKLKCPVNNDRCFRFMWIFYIGEGCLLFILGIFKMLSFYPNWLIITAEILFNFFLSICTNMQLTILIFILVRYHQFNKFIQNENNLSWQLVKKLSTIYDRLNESLDKNNKCFFAILCLWVGIWFVLAIFTVFSVIISWFNFDMATIKFVISDSATFFVSALLFVSTMLIANLIVREVSYNVTFKFVLSKFI